MKVNEITDVLHMLVYIWFEIASKICVGAPRHSILAGRIDFGKCLAAGHVKMY